MRTVLALGHGHHSPRGVAEDLGRLVAGEERVAQLGLRGWVAQPAGAQRGDGTEVGLDEPLHTQCGQAADESAPSYMPTRYAGGPPLTFVSSGKRKRANWVACATTRPPESQTTHVSSTVPSDTTLASILMPSQPGAGQART